MLPSQSRQPVRINELAQASAAFMSRVYLWMMVGIAITGITAYIVSLNPNTVAYIMTNPWIFYGLIAVQLGSVVAISGWVQRMNVGTASFVYALYATLVGLTFSSIFLVYTMESISSTFFVTSFAFAGISVFGYTTKRDLGPVGTFCMIGLFGMIGIMLLGFFIPSMMTNSMQLTMSVVGILIFSGLTAYDTQRIKALQLQYVSADQARKGAILGALILYLDFINIFINLLRLMGDRR